MSDTHTPAAAAENTAPAQGGISSSPTPVKVEPRLVKIKDREYKEEDAYAEIERGRQSTKLLTEANKRAQEASRRDKDWETLVSEVKTKKDAKKVIERLGLSKDEAVDIFGRWLYQEEVLPKEMSPEQRRIKELEAEGAKYKDAEAARAKEAKDAEEQQLTRKEEARLKAELTKVIQDKKIPGTRLALRRLANYLGTYAEAGQEVTTEQAADMVMEDYRQEFSELMDEATPDQLAEFFGEQKWRMLARKVSDWALSRARGNVKVPDVQVKSRPPAPKEEKMNPQEFQKWLRSVK